ncbi:MAG: hypothetical protein NTV89_18040 [Proteobacteria bacterium]|nr:hypothetical protein [Pseudomonadota bacterium]
MSLETDNKNLETKENKETPLSLQSEIDKQKVPPKQEKEIETETEVKEFVKTMPPQVRKSFEMAMMQTFSSRGPGFHPIFDKFNEKHIDKFLDYSHSDDDNEFKLKSSNRYFYFGYSLLCMGIFTFLVVYLLPNNKDLLLELFKLIVIFGGGFGSGFGVKSFLDKKK